MNTRNLIFVFILGITITAFYAQPAFSGEKQDKPSKSDSAKVRIEKRIIPDSQSTEPVVKPDNSKKRKKALPMFFIAGLSYLAFNATSNYQPGPAGPPLSVDEPVRNFKKLDRSPDVNITVSSRREKYSMGDDIALYQNIVNESVNRHIDVDHSGLVWRGDNLIGRLNPVYVSIKEAKSGDITVLVAGLDNLADGQTACVQLYDNETVYTIELNGRDGDMFGVFRTDAALDISEVALSIDLIR
jgi:hypothetical protein